MHASLPVAVVSVIIKDNKILLLKRQNTPWMNSYRWVPGWRLDAWESMTSWAIRELKEEIWIDLDEKNILFKSIVQHKDERWERIYFIVNFSEFAWSPVNNEPEKCAWIEWFSLDNLPENITPQVEICLDCVKNRIEYLEYGY